MPKSKTDRVRLSACKEACGFPDFVGLSRSIVKLTDREPSTKTKGDKTTEHYELSCMYFAEPVVPADAIAKIKAWVAANVGKVGTSKGVEIQVFNESSTEIITPTAASPAPAPVAAMDPAAMMAQFMAFMQQQTAAKK